MRVYSFNQFDSLKDLISGLTGKSDNIIYGQNKEALESKEIVSTIEKLLIRIKERFPESGLAKECSDLLSLAKEANQTVEWISKPNYLMRIFIGMLIIIFGLLAGYSVTQLEFKSARELRMICQRATFT